MLPGVHSLIAEGLVSPAAVVGGDLTLRPAGGRSGRTFTVLRQDGPSYFVKDSDEPGRAAREAAVIALLTAHGPMRAHTPRLVPGLCASGRLVLDVVPGRDLAAHHATAAAVPPALGRAVGAAFGALHATPLPEAERARATRPPEVLTLAAPGLALYLSMSAANVACLRTVQGADGFAEGLAALAAGWRADALVHGDVRLANVMVAGAEGPEPDVRLVDWEDAGAGDAAWDVGSLLAGYLSLWLTSVPDLPGLSDAELLARVGRPMDGLRPGIAALWEGYRDAHGLEDDPARATLLRCVRWAGAALLEIALVIGQEAHEPSRHQLLHLQLARDLLTRPLEAGVRMLGFRGAQLARPW